MNAIPIDISTLTPWIGWALTLGFAVAAGRWLRGHRARRHPARTAALRRPRSNKALEKRDRLQMTLGELGDELVSGAIVLEVRHLMSTSLETAPPTASPGELADLMAAHGVRHVPICRGYGKLVGIVSNRDVASRSGESAQEIMTQNPVTVTPSTPLARAIELMLKNNISCLPVLHGEHLCGLLTTTDVVLGTRCLCEIFKSQRLPATIAS